MLTLTFLGVGSAFARRNFQSNVLVEAWHQGPARQSTPDDTLLIDFGGTGPTALHRLKEKEGFAYLRCGDGVAYPTIRRLLVTHLHADHIGGLEEFAMVSRYVLGQPGTTAAPHTELIATPELIDRLWTESLRGGLEAQRGRPARLDDYFRVRPVHLIGSGEPDRFMLLDRYRFTLFRTDHVRMRRKYDWPSCGVLITDTATNATVLFSGDTRFDPAGLGSMMIGAAAIFHDVQLEEEPDAIHATLSELRGLDESTRAKITLYHYGDRWDHADFVGVAVEFAGFARPQYRYPLFGDDPAQPVGHAPDRSALIGP
ncbi:MAG: MBL fold metallo-hydrolase [Phycisphaerae bacterium]